MKKERTKEFLIRLLDFEYEDGAQSNDGDNEVEMTFKDIKRLAIKLTKYVNDVENQKEYKNWKSNEFFLDDEVKVVDKWEWE